MQDQTPGRAKEDQRPLERRGHAAVANEMQWEIEAYGFDREARIRGWAFCPGGQTSDARFLLNGEPFETVQYPRPSDELGTKCWSLPAFRMASFRCHSEQFAGAFRNRFAEFEFLPKGVSTADTRLRRYYLLDPRLEAPMPGPRNLVRVIGTTRDYAYRLRGATLAKRIETYLETRLERPLSSFRRVLDWGCGAGRLSRYLRLAEGLAITGADVDAVNVAWCREHLPDIDIVHLPLRPPSPFPDNHFDLIIGISVFTHLRPGVQDAWLAELRRIAAPGAILLMSVHGPATYALSGAYREALLRNYETKGITVDRVNEQIADGIPAQDYYVNTQHTPAYIHRHWGEHFVVVEIAGSYVFGQSLVVMYKPD